MFCTACHKLLAHHWEPYEHLLKNNYLKEEVLDALNIDRECCRRIMLSSTNITRKMLHYRVDIMKRSEILNYFEIEPIPSPTPLIPKSDLDSLKDMIELVKSVIHV